MSSLIFVSQIGAVEGNLFTALKHSEDFVIFYDIVENRFYPENIIPANTWISQTFVNSEHLLLSRYFSQLIETHKIDHVFAIGIEAIIYANSNIDSHDVIALVMKGELDFSIRRTGLLERFMKAVTNSKRLFFEDTWEMDKASAHGSEVPHFVYPLFIQPKNRILDHNRKNTKIAIIEPTVDTDSDLEVRINLYQEQLLSHGFEIKRIKARDLYTKLDLSTGRTFPATMRYRIGDCSHAILIGDSRNGNSILAGLSEDAEYLYAEDTFNTSLILSKDEFPNYANAVSLINRLVGDLTTEEGGSAGAHIRVPLTSPVASLERDMQYNYPWFYESTPRLSVEKSFDLYFTVSPIENRANGARPLRIRNMAESIYKNRPTVLITSNAKLLRRKIFYIRWLIESGFKANMFYGENSTSPIATYDVISQLLVLLEILKLNGCSIGWFVRDLHWLDPEIGANGLMTSTQMTTVSRGLHELGRVAHLADMLYAPNLESIQGFRKLLGDQVSISTPWAPLQPGVSESNFWDKNHLTSPNVNPESVTIVYSGGIGDVYNMDLFLSSIHRFEPSLYFFDFVIRKSDRALFDKSLLQFNLAGYSNIRVLHCDFQDYIPTTVRSVGTIFLSSSYAKFSFPYKTMTMIEKGFPIVTFSDMAIAEFVIVEGIGRVCSRSEDDIFDCITSVVKNIEHFDFRAVRESHSWRARTETVLSLTS